MRYSSPERWTDQLQRATITLLAAAVGLYIAWQLISTILPVLIILSVLMLIIRLALGLGRRGDGW